MRLQEVGGRATQEAKAEYRLRAWDNITQLEGRGPTLFTQPTSRGSGDCIYANNSKNDQDTTDDCMEAGGRAKQEARAEEAVSQGQAISAGIFINTHRPPFSHIFDLLHFSCSYVGIFHSDSEPCDTANFEAL